MDLKIETTDKQLEEAKTSKRNQKKLEIIDKLSRLNELEPEEQQKLFIELDRRVGVAQRKIAIKCVDPKERKYTAMKEVVDAIDRTYKDKYNFKFALAQICLNAKIAFSNLKSPPFPSSIQILSFKMSYQLSHLIK